MMRYVARFSECLFHFVLLKSLGEPLILLALFVVWGSVTMAHASSFSWNTLNGQFNDSASWTFTPVLSDLDGVPDANDVVTLRRGNIATYTVTFPGTGLGNGVPVNYVTDQLRVGNNNVSFVEGNSTVRPFPSVPSTYTVDNLTTADLGRGMIVGETASDTAATLTTRLATLSATAATIGDAAGSNGTLNVNAGTFSVTGSSATDQVLFVGNHGDGALNVNNGADINVADETWLGRYPGSVGTVGISGGGSTWTNDGRLYVGGGGAGVLNVTGGGFLRTQFHSYIGSAGTVSIAGGGSAWTNNGDIYVGNFGAGTLSIANGGQVSSDFCFVGYGAGSMGAVRVDGIGSSLTLTYDLYFGEQDGQGIIDIVNGGKFIFRGGYIGSAFGTTCTANVDGAGSTLKSTTLTVGGFNATSALNITNGGTVSAENLTVNTLGEVHGNGNITGTVLNSGLISPGNSPGALTITGDFNQMTGGKLQFALEGVMVGMDYDQLVVTGGVFLDGGLDVLLTGGFAPSEGNTFHILSFTSLAGAFATLNLPTLTGGLAWDTSQLYVDGTLSVGYMPGDYNRNGVVDAADYTMWRDSLGSTTNLAADGNQNGMIDSGDYDVWKSKFGNHSGSGANANAAVPEPATLWMLLAGILTMCARRRQKRS